MIHIKFRRLLPLIALLLVFWMHLWMMHSSAMACPTCKEALGNDPYAAQMIQGYFWSIVFMMSMPFLILGSLSTYFYLLIRKARTQQAALAMSGTAMSGTATMSATALPLV